MTNVIETNELGKQYGRKWALHQCTLSVPEAKVVGLVGPNGAGKTTLLQLAVGLLSPTTGTIEVLGGRPAESPRNSGRFGSAPRTRRPTRGYRSPNTFLWVPGSIPIGTQSLPTRESMI